MKLPALLAFCAVSMASFAGGRLALSQDGAKAPVAPEGMDMQAMMEAMRLAQPGPEHEELAKYAGEWETEISVSMPGMPAMEQEATETARTILGGRYLEIVSEGDFMGQPFEGRVILGFDRRHEVYTLIGLDTLGTYWVTGQGSKGEDGVLRLHGEDDDPSGRQVYTYEYDFSSEDEFTYRVLFTQLGPQEFEEPYEMVRVRATRIK